MSKSVQFYLSFLVSKDQFLRLFRDSGVLFFFSPFPFLICSLMLPFEMVPEDLELPAVITVCSVISSYENTRERITVQDYGKETRS